MKAHTLLRSRLEKNLNYVIFKRTIDLCDIFIVNNLETSKWYSMHKQYTLKIEKDEDEYYVASVMELPGCHTQAKSLSMLIERIKEAILLYLEVTTIS